MKLGLYKIPRNRGIQLKKKHISQSADDYDYLDGVLEKTSDNLDTFMDILKYCKNENVDLLMHDDIVRNLNTEIVFKYNHIIFAEFADKFNKIKKYVDKHKINLYIYTSLFAGLNSKRIELREKSRRDIQMKAKLLDAVGGKGMIYAVSTLNNMGLVAGMEAIFDSYALIRTELTDKYMMLSNGTNCLTFEDVLACKKKYGCRTVYQPSVDYQKNFMRYGFDAKYDELCAKVADLVMFSPFDRVPHPKKKELIEIGDFPDYYYDIDGTIIINTYHSDDSIDLIREWEK